MEELRGGEGQPLIVQGQPKANNSMTEVGSQFIRAFLGIDNGDILNVLNKKRKDKKKKDKKKKKKDGKKKDQKKKNKKEAYNIFEADHDGESPNGWSVIVTNEQLDVFEDTDFGVFMVNLTEGSMTGPHWNPGSAEVAIVLHGQGMVQVVCPMIPKETVCKNSRFRVEEGDVFVVPQYHPMAEMSFSNESFVFMGFTMILEDYPSQYLVGKTSILQALDKTVLAKSFDVSNTTLMDEVLSAKKESIILECTSCAEDEERLMEEEVEREWEGGRGGRQEAEIEGEIARRQEDEMRRRLREAEEAASKRRAAVGVMVDDLLNCIH